MLLLSSNDLKDRKVLLLEQDPEYLALFNKLIADLGAKLCGCVDSGMGAVSFARLAEIDCVVVHVRTLQQIPFHLPAIMASFGVEVIHASSFDEWFELEDEVDDFSEGQLEVQLPTVVIRSERTVSRGSEHNVDPRLMTIVAKKPWPSSD